VCATIRETVFAGTTFAEALSGQRQRDQRCNGTGPFLSILLIRRTRIDKQPAAETPSEGFIEKAVLSRYTVGPVELGKLNVLPKKTAATSVDTLAGVTAGDKSRKDCDGLYFRYM